MSRIIDKGRNKQCAVLLGGDIRTLNPGGRGLAAAVALLGGQIIFRCHSVNFCNTLSHVASTLVENSYKHEDSEQGIA